jgi:HD-GYP domain-containing protein (c-di-GMP phosphodiesterase class II)
MIMDKKRRAEQLVAVLRWFVIGLGLVAISDGVPRMSLGVMLLFLAAYNGWMTYCTADSARFASYGRKCGYICKVLDAGLISVAIALANAYGSYAYLMYWFPLIASGYTSTKLHKLLVGGAMMLVANGAATFCAFSLAGEARAAAGPIALRSFAVALGFLVAVYIARTRTQDELVSERGAYLQAILNCGARLTSFRDVRELALYALESAVTETGSSGGQLLLLNEETSDLTCEAFYSASGPSQENGVPQDTLLRSYATWVMSSGHEFLVRPGGKPGEVAATANNEHPAIAVPLLWHSSNSASENSVLGVLIVWGYAGEDFADDVLDILRIFATIAGAAIVNLRLYTNLQKSFLKTLQSLANGLEARDEYTRGHSERVMQVAELVASELGVASDSIDSLRNASLLHDIGKIGIPDSILRKAGKLTAEEWEQMRRHPLVSEEICRPLGLAPDVLFLIKHHHEHLDGNGYPSGLHPQDLPLLQRILVVADSFDAMRSRRPYRDCMPREELVSELSMNAGRTLDPTVVDAVLNLLDCHGLDAVYAEHDTLIHAIDRFSKQDIQEAA